MSVRCKIVLLGVKLSTHNVSSFRCWVKRVKKRLVVNVVTKDE